MVASISRIGLGDVWDANQATEAEVAGLVTVLQEALAELL